MTASPRRTLLAVEHPRIFSTTPTMVPLTFILAGLIKARHLRGLAADERAAVGRAGAAKPRMISVNTCGSSLPVPR